jgi:type II secretory pathway component GspD/PulD (secretin)
VQRTYLVFPVLLALLVSARPAPGQESQRPPPAPSPPTNQAAAAPSAPGPAGFKRQIVPVNYWPASEIKKLLAPLVTPGGAVLDQPGGKSLTIVDSPANIQNLIEIKEAIDVAAFAGARIETFQPRAASAEELAAALTEITRSTISSGAPEGDPFVEFIPLPRNNQLLIIARSESGVTHARRWLDRLDAAAGPTRRVFVLPVEKGKANELAGKLKQAKNPISPEARIVADPVTDSLVVYATAEEFQEMKNILTGGRTLEEFKQKLLSIRRKIEATGKIPPAPAEKTGKAL